MKTLSLDDLPDDAKVLDCAGCGTLMLSRRENRYEDEPYHAGTILGRPYCQSCLAFRRVPSSPATFDPEGAGPWQENAIRDMEDAGE